ncbi:MAG: RNA polymerase sigma factor [Anaerolineae bacterium]|nr:RNA polymerase sigma factor [Anaerolineae bacterium]
MDWAQLPVEREYGITADSSDILFNTLYQQHSVELCSYLTRLTDDPGRAEELMHETFIQAYRAMLDGVRWENPRAWLYRVASRLAINAYRRQKLIAWVPFFGTDPASGPGIEAAALERVAVQAALNALPPKYRIPLVLYVYAEQSVVQIADILNLSSSAVKMRLSRAREMFHRAYVPEESL